MNWKTPATVIALIKNIVRKIRANKIVKNIGVYIGGNFIQQVAQVILVPVWAIFLTPEDYGITGLVNIYISILSTVMGLGFQGAVSRHYFDFEEDHQDQKRFISSLVIFQILFSVFFAIVLSVFGKGVWDTYISKTVPFDPYIRIAVWIAFLRSWTITLLYLYQAQQKAKNFVSLQLLSFILNSLGMLAFVVFLRRGAYGQVLGSLLEAVIMGVILFVLFSKKWFITTMDWQNIKSGLKYGLPLVPHSIFAWANTAADRVILDKFVSITEIGFYNFGYNIGSVIQAIVESVNMAWTPYYFRLMSKKEKPNNEIIRFYSIYLVVVGFICVCGVLFIKDIFKLFFPARYLPAVIYIPPIITAYLFSGLYKFGSSPLFFFKKTKIIPIITGGSALVNIVLNLWLAPKYGALASAWITTGTYVILSILAFCLSHKYSPVPYPYIKTVALASFLIFCTIISPFISEINLVSFIFKMLLCGFYLFLSYKLFISPLISGRSIQLLFKTH